MTDIKDASIEAAYQADQDLGNLPEGRKVLSNNDVGARVLDRYEESVRDPLTGAYNRRYLDKELDTLVEKEQPFALLLIDIDKFKIFNDKYGHLAGDAALRHLVAVVSTTIKVGKPEGKEDTIAKYGGEEFGIVLNGVSALKTAKAVAERIRTSIENTFFSAKNGEKLKMTISGGVSVFNKTDNLDSFVKRVDQALYEAKEKGRNKIVSK